MTQARLSRYERHIDLPGVGIEGQKKLLSSSALIVGLGGLGCPAALYLACAGVGKIGLVDADTVSITNLQRQVLYTESDLNKKKTTLAKERLIQHASHCEAIEYDSYLTSENAQEVINKYDIVLDCTDNFDSRYLINAHCVRNNKPLVSASIYHHDGQVSVFKGHLGDGHPCYQCLYPKNEKLSLIPQCKDSGILGPIAGVFGTLQATIAINELLGIGSSLSGQMLMLGALDFEVQKIGLQKRGDCEVCSPNSLSRDYKDLNTSCGII